MNIWTRLRSKEAQSSFQIDQKMDGLNEYSGCSTTAVFWASVTYMPYPDICCFIHIITAILRQSCMHARPWSKKLTKMKENAWHHLKLMLSKVNSFHKLESLHQRCKMGPQALIYLCFFFVFSSLLFFDICIANLRSETFKMIYMNNSSMVIYRIQSMHFKKNVEE